MIKIMNCLWCKKDYEYDYFESQIRYGRGKYCSCNCQRYAKSDKQKFWQYADWSSFLNRIKKSYETKVCRQEGCWSWNGATKTGYGSIRIQKNNVGAHRISWMIYKGEIPEGMWVLHKCDNPICSNPEHLFLGSREDNMRDMFIKNRGRSGKAKLIPEQVVEIKKKLDEGIAMTELSSRFNISYGAIRGIKNNINWRYI